MRSFDVYKDFDKFLSDQRDPDGLRSDIPVVVKIDGYNYPVASIDFSDALSDCEEDRVAVWIRVVE